MPYSYQVDGVTIDTDYKPCKASLNCAKRSPASSATCRTSSAARCTSTGEPLHNQRFALCVANRVEVRVAQMNWLHDAIADAAFVFALWLVATAILARGF
jgi:hypothetical protein